MKGGENATTQFWYVIQSFTGCQLFNFMNFAKRINHESSNMTFINTPKKLEFFPSLPKSTFYKK